MEVDLLPFISFLCVTIRVPPRPESDRAHVNPKVGWMAGEPKF